MAIDTRLHEIVKVKLKDFGENNTLTIDESKIREYKTLINESELIRIVKHLNPANCKIGKSGFPLLTDLLTVSITIDDYKQIPDGEITFNGIRYKRLLSSSGNIRNKKVIFINEELYDKANEILLCGMPTDMEHDVLAKFSAYYAMASTDSTPVTMGNIAVIDDYEKEITEIFDLVKETAQDEYEVENGVNHTVSIKPFDGAGLVDISLAKVWAKELGLDYIPSAFQFRCIPGIKGNLYVFDLKKFATEFGKTQIKDAFKCSKQWDIFENKINIIMTKSQFKFLDKYDSYQSWLDAFNKELYGYKRTFNISNVADNVAKLPKKKPLSYQPLQSLELDKNQIKELCSDTVDTIKKISTDVDEFLKFRGIAEIYEDERKENFIPDYYKALKVEKSLFADDWMQKKIQFDINNFKKKIYRGSIFVNGNYQTFIPDIFGLAEYAFGLLVKGLLDKDQIYSNYWLKKGITVVDIIRFPHIAMEHKVSNVVSPAKKEYYRYISEGIIINLYDSTALKLNGADFDNDKVLTTSNQVLIQAAKENMSNTIVYVPSRNDTTKVPNRIDDMQKLIETDVAGMGNDIGKVVNKITTLWSLSQAEQVKDHIKIMSIVGALTIDFVKTGVRANVPKEIKQFLKGIKKPYFTKYIKANSSQVTEEKRRNNINEILGEEEEYTFEDRDCTMNRVCKYMEKQAKNIKFRKDSSEFNWPSLISATPYPYNKTYPKIVATLNKLKTEHDQIALSHIFVDYNRDGKTENEYRYKVFYAYARSILLTICLEMDKLIDYIVYAFYADQKFAIENHDKAILWNCFGEELNKRIKGETQSEKIDEAKLLKKSQKLKKKVEEIKDNDKIVNIQLFKDKEISATVSKSEMQYIKKNISPPEARQLAFVLLVLSRFCESLELPYIEIHQGKRDKITKTPICKLADIDDRKYKGWMDELNKSEVIKLTTDKNGLVLLCNVLFKDNEADGSIVIKDLNKCRKHFKKLR